MSENSFNTAIPSIHGNPNLRTPQREGYEALKEVTSGDEESREVGVVLPVGCGKSGLITLAPFAFTSQRVLVIAPNLKIAEQLFRDFDPSNTQMFYQKCHILPGPPYPEPAEIRGNSSNSSDLECADVVITNIQQLQGSQNRWLEALPDDFFDLILVDEGHHNVADSWETLRNHFPDAYIVNFTATPTRSDGRLMEGRIVYTYSVFRAIQEGYVKRLRAVVLNPSTLRFVRHEDGQEIEVNREEVRRLGEEDSSFRRGIVTSEETLNTIVDASIRELDRIRKESGDQRHKIIASALNYNHCIQIVEAYKARGRSADYVHSREDSPVNERVFQKLESHDLDVIVQVRKLGEGFDHPYLSVAAVFSIFQNLSPFVQFVGRIMRVIDQNNPSSLNNQGTVVFHLGGNIASRWDDFREYSQADQEFFDQLLPMEDLDFSSSDELSVEPIPREMGDSLTVQSQTDVMLEEIPLIEEDEELRRAAELLSSHGVTAEDYQRFTELQPIPTTRQRQRRASRQALDDQIRNTTGSILSKHNISPGGCQLDRQHIGKTNFVVIKSAIDRKVNELVGRGSGNRQQFSQDEMDRITTEYLRLVEEVEQEIFNA